MGKRKKREVPAVSRTTDYLMDMREGKDNRIWNWTPELASLSYMRPCKAPDGSDGPSVITEENAVQYRIPEILAVMTRLREDDYVKTGPKTGYPSVYAFNRILGWDNPVTSEERDEAWERYKGEE